MKFDPQTVEQAEAFVNALRAGKRAHMPALRCAALRPVAAIYDHRLRWSGAGITGDGRLRAAGKEKPCHN